MRFHWSHPRIKEHSSLDITIIAIYLYLTAGSGVNDFSIWQIHQQRGEAKETEQDSLGVLVHCISATGAEKLLDLNPFVPIRLQVTGKSLETHRVMTVLIDLLAPTLRTPIRPQLKSLFKDPYRFFQFPYSCPAFFNLSPERCYPSLWWCTMVIHKFFLWKNFLLLTFVSSGLIFRWFSHIISLRLFQHFACQLQIIFDIYRISLKIWILWLWSFARLTCGAIKKCSLHTTDRLVLIDSAIGDLPNIYGVSLHLVEFSCLHRRNFIYYI